MLKRRGRLIGPCGMKWCEEASNSVGEGGRGVKPVVYQQWQF